MCNYTQTTYRSCSHNIESLASKCTYGEKYGPLGHDKLFEIGSLKTVEDKCPACGGPAAPVQSTESSEMPTTTSHAGDSIPTPAQVHAAKTAPVTSEPELVDLTHEDEVMLDIDADSESGDQSFDDFLRGEAFLKTEDQRRRDSGVEAS